MVGWHHGKCSSLLLFDKRCVESLKKENELGKSCACTRQMSHVHLKSAHCGRRSARTSESREHCVREHINYLEYVTTAKRS